MLLHLSDLSPEPLHQQVSRQLREKILAGDLQEGDSLPSIRSFARDHRVSVITVQRAYEDLNREGLLVGRQGKGVFVASLDGKGKQMIALDRLREALAPILREARQSGLTEKDIKRLIDEIVRAEEVGS
ncbi:GntR family transcriptional regulator [bacterium]|nr:GntR family transcriptional regulator [bacterium]